MNIAPRTPSLASTTWAFITLTAAAIAVAGFFVMRTAGDRLATEVLDEVVRVRTQAAAHFLGRRLERDWGEFAYVADLPTLEEGPYLQGQIDGFALSGERVSWAVIADNSGRVAAASNSGLIGTDVGSASWFGGGREGSFAESVSDPSAAGILRFAVPVGHTSGVAAVAARELRRQRVDDYLFEAAEALQVELFVLAPSGDMLLSSVGADYPRDGLPSRGAAIVGRAGTFREVWPDGESYVVSVAAPFAGNEMPPIGWRMVGRIPVRDSPLRVSDLRPLATRLGGATGAILLLTSLLFIIFALAPFRRLANFSAGLLNGKDGGYPPEERTTREARILSAAVARLQGRIHNK